MTRIRFSILLVALLAASPAAQADPKPHALFSDHAVFQRNAQIPIWGTADPGERVQVTLRVKIPSGAHQESISTTADAAGKWMVRLGPFEAGTDGVLTIKGKTTVERKDIAIGEVWVCSGQSNMEWSLAMIPKEGGPEHIKNSKNDKLRVFTVPKYAVPTPQAGFNPKPPNDKFSKWLPSAPEHAAMFSAVAYFFGRDLQKALNVPVGLIHTSWGGTPAQAWTSREVLAKDPELRHYVDSLDPNKIKANYETALAKWMVDAQKARAEGKKEPPMPKQRTNVGNSPFDAASLYNGMIAPLLPYAVKGAIWYQGESNAGAPIEYRNLFASMIQDWRSRWGHSFPFYCVQLAPWHAGDVDGQNWAFLREAQGIASDRVKNAGVAVITDVGDKADIHPQKKEPVGARLALLALHRTYGQKVEDSGPTYKAMKASGNKVTLSFTHLGGGLVAQKFSMDGAENVGADGKLVGFEVAGADKKFHPATATIEGDTVVLTSDAVSAPVAVRYGWKNFPVCNLANKAGLPASPFRTDDYPWPGK